MAKAGRLIHVLLVEDNPGDVTLVRQALQTVGTAIQLHVAMDGRAAMQFVAQSKPRPNLIILDINIPEKSGHEVLQELKGDAELREIPVVVFTSSGANRDVRTAYRLHANSYVRKPEDVDEFFAAVTDMERFWTRTAMLPVA